jgi:hypothetical protein
MAGMNWERDRVFEFVLKAFRSFRRAALEGNLEQLVTAREQLEDLVDLWRHVDAGGRVH